jgi:hypothetical protein
MHPGEHYFGERADGHSLRDTILILLPGPQMMFVKLMRACLDGNVVENLLKHGHGALNIDGCRVTTNESTLRPNSGQGTVREQWRMSVRPHISGSTSGRWPTNFLLVHGPGCRRIGTAEVAAPVINRFSDGMKPFGEGAGHPYEQSGGGTETIPIWYCQDDCPVRLLDEQSGVLRARGNITPTTNVDHGIFTAGSYERPEHGDPGDAGGASRFFPQFASLEEALAWLHRLIGVDP